MGARTCRGSSPFYKLDSATGHCGGPAREAQAAYGAMLLLLDQARRVDEDERMVRDLQLLVQRTKVRDVSLIGPV